MSSISKFKAAMNTVYGPLIDHDTEVNNWDPPERSGGHRGRYLWTDAFGVVNFLTLHKETGDPSYLHRATRLVGTVHNVLGRTRDGNSWLPGASDKLPVGGGLRIGKEDEGGSDGDGQYHHYLTLWMFALNRLSMATDDDKYNDLAVALAKAIHPHFVISSGSKQPRMIWKISMDREQVLVNSQGNLDPIDGFVVFTKLQAMNPYILADEIKDYQRIIDQKGWNFSSNDTLDLGMALWTSHWLAGEEGEPYFEKLQRQIKGQLQNLFEQGYLDAPVGRRLAFREYGTALAIGCLDDPGDELQRFRDGIIETWEQHFDSTPEDLRPITEVMRAAALVPGAFKKGYLGEEPEL